FADADARGMQGSGLSPPDRRERDRHRLSAPFCRGWIGHYPGPQDGGRFDAGNFRGFDQRASPAADGRHRLEPPAVPVAGGVCDARLLARDAEVSAGRMLRRRTSNPKRTQNKPETANNSQPPTRNETDWEESKTPRRRGLAPVFGTAGSDGREVERESDTEVQESIRKPAQLGGKVGIEFQEKVGSRRSRSFSPALTGHLQVGVGHGASASHQSS